MKSDRFSLAGKTALVTGANSGLGRAIADGFAEVGATVIAVVRDADKGRGIVGAASVIEHDVRDRGGAQRVVDRAEEVNGSIDVLVNSAGRGGRGPVDEYPWDLWDDIGVYLACVK